MYIPWLDTEDKKLDQHIEENNYITAQNFDYFHCLGKWLRGLELRVYSPLQSEEYPTNKIFGPNYKQKPLFDQNAHKKKN
jgi:hypothetical protein